MLRCFWAHFLNHARVRKPKNRTFGQNVYRLRNAANLTQEQLAERANISRRYVQMIEAGQYTPTIEIASRLRAAFSVSWDVVMKGV
jgi:transcriptional regulator with XRE-family HTH domain